MSGHPESSNQGRSPGGLTRRGFITAAGVVAAGGALAGNALANLGTAKAGAPAEAPPLPWAWPRLDPLEAGERAFRTYHEKGG